MNWPNIAALAWILSAPSAPGAELGQILETANQEYLDVRFNEGVKAAPAAGAVTIANAGANVPVGSVERGFGSQQELRIHYATPLSAAPTDLEVCFKGLALGTAAPQDLCLYRENLPPNFAERYNSSDLLLGGSATSGRGTLDDVAVNVAIIDPKTVHDAFGRRISRRFVAFQVTVGNNNEDFDFLIHGLNLLIPRDLTPEEDVEGQTPEQKTKAETDRLKKRFTALRRCGDAGEVSCIEYHSIDLALLRGVAEQGRTKHPRNVVVRALEATGAIAGAVVGVADPVSTAWGNGIAAFNGPIVTALKAAVPDQTLNQLNRLNDSAYTANTIVPDEYARVMVGFVPQDLLMSKLEANTFRKDPYIGLRNFLPVHARVTGHFIAELDDVPPVISDVVLDAGAAGYERATPEIDGRIVGRFLAGAELSVTGFDGATVEVQGEATNERISFRLKSTKPIPPDTRLDFIVTRDANETRHTEQVSYNPTPPSVSNIDPPTAVQGAGEVPIVIEGSDFKDGAVVEIEGLDAAIDKIESGRIEAKLTVAEDATVKAYSVRVRTGALFSNSKPFTVEAPSQPAEEEAGDGDSADETPVETPPQN